MIRGNSDRPRKHKGRTADRLKAALAKLTADRVSNPGQSKLTITELCRVASVSSNSVYRYHADIVLALRKIQRQHPAIRSVVRNETHPLRKEISALREQLGKLVTLVDHYYSAYRETSALLQRRERELADLRRKLHSKPMPVAR